MLQRRRSLLLLLLLSKLSCLVVAFENPFATWQGSDGDDDAELESELEQFPLSVDTSYADAIDSSIADSVLMDADDDNADVGDERHEDDHTHDTNDRAASHEPVDGEDANDDSHSDDADAATDDEEEVQNHYTDYQLERMAARAAAKEKFIQEVAHEHERAWRRDARRLGVVIEHDPELDTPDDEDEFAALAGIDLSPFHMHSADKAVLTRLVGWAYDRTAQLSRFHDGFVHAEELGRLYSLTLNPTDDVVPDQYLELIEAAADDVRAVQGLVDHEMAVPRGFISRGMPLRALQSLAQQLHEIHASRGLAERAHTSEL